MNALAITRGYEDRAGLVTMALLSVSRAFDRVGSFVRSSPVHSGSVMPEPPISAGMSFIFGLPS
jgi:hypothetical protein